MNQYQALRSISDDHTIVICRDCNFCSLPDHVRHQGSWQAMGRGQIDRLKPEYWLDLAEQGVVLLRTTTAAFQPEG